MTGRTAVALLGAIGVMLVLAPPHGVGGPANPFRDVPGTVVYIRAGNIFLLEPSTATVRQVTREGNYRSPSLADDGTVGALQKLDETWHFVTITPTGRKHAFPRGPGIIVTRAELSPDGRFFAFDYATGLRSNLHVDVTPADRWAPGKVAGTNVAVMGISSSYAWPRWMTNERLILSGLGSWPFLVRGPRGGLEGEQSPYRVRVADLADDRFDFARNGSRFVVTGRSEQRGQWFVVVFRPLRPGEQVQANSTVAVRADGVPAWVAEGGWVIQGEPWKGHTISPDGKAVAFADDRGLLVGTAVGPNLQAYVVDPKGSEPEWSPFALTR